MAGMTGAAAFMPAAMFIPAPPSFGAAGSIYWINARSKTCTASCRAG